MQTRPEISLQHLGLPINQGGDMDRITGAACSACGCEDSEYISQSTWWGQVEEKRRCANCGTIFTAKVESQPAKMVVKYVRIRCPKCASKNVRTTSTRGTIRWHKCGDCQQTFQSVEQ